MKIISFESCIYRFSLLLRAFQSSGPLVLLGHRWSFKVYSISKFYTSSSVRRGRKNFETNHSWDQVHLYGEEGKKLPLGIQCSFSRFRLRAAVKWLCVTERTVKVKMVSLRAVCIQDLPDPEEPELRWPELLILRENYRLPLVTRRHRLRALTSCWIRCL